MTLASQATSATLCQPKSSMGQKCILPDTLIRPFAPLYHTSLPLTGPAPAILIRLEMTLLSPGIVQCPLAPDLTEVTCPTFVLFFL